MVILIIALLAALLTNAVQSSREMGRRAQCLSRMRELGTVAIDFESRNNGYPGWLDPVFGPAPAPPQQPQRYVNSWIYQLLPALGRSDLTDKSLLPWNAASLVALNDLLVCPTDSEKMALRAPQSPTSFVCNAGRRDYPTPTASLPADWRSNAVFVNRDDLPGGNPVKVEVTDASFIAKGNGLAFTLLLSENLDAGTWYNIIPNPANETVNCVVFWPPDSQGQPPKPVHFINGMKDNTSTAYDLARPSSLHPGGVNMFFCGGQGRFVSDRMDYRIYCALMTPRSATAMDPGTTTLTGPTVNNLPQVTEEALQ